ncbi:MAG TPA: flagellar hook capping FlgD N-terminal domain-containing protein [Bacillota bacterium]|nr:flagellar hook capping FlgD N-terminal domain-containing protein [Bacillota bacterium]
MQVSAASGNGYQDTYKSSVLDRSGMGKDAFLQLLVNQLRNQDPLNPVNDKEFLAQMAQFSTLEQMQNLNQSFEKGLAGIIEAVDVGLYDNFKALLSINNNLVMQQNFQAISLLGKEISVVLETEEGQETVAGTVQRVAFKDGRVQMEIDGRQIYMDKAVQFEIIG